MSSSCDSLKSVVMCGWLSADPNAAGCGVSANLPSGLTRRLSFSIPRCRLRNTSGARADNRLSNGLNRDPLDSKAAFDNEVDFNATLSRTILLGVVARLRRWHKLEAGRQIG